MNNDQKGQGLLETIIAIGLVVTGLIGSITLVNFTLRSTGNSMNQLIALQLAWEGVEVALHLRDSNYLAEDDFDVGLVSGGDTTAIFTFDVDTNTWVSDFSVNSIDEAGAVLRLQGGVYRQANPPPPGEATAFRRLITLDPAEAGAIRVVSTVEWDDRGNTHSVSSERILYDWR